MNLVRGPHSISAPASLVERAPPGAAGGGAAGFLVAVLLVAGCATPVAKRLDELAERDPAPFSALLSVRCEPDPQLARRVEEEITSALERSRALSLLRSAKDAKQAGSEAADITADITIDVTLRLEGLHEQGHDLQGTLLGVLAWSTVPPLSFWVRDVNYDLGVVPQVEVRWPQPGERLLARPFPRAPFGTSLVDRRDFASDPWPYLGSIVVPPAVFSGADEARLEERLLARLLPQLSLWLAREIKEELQPRALAERGRLAVSLRGPPEVRGSEGTVRFDVELPSDQDLTLFAVELNGLETPGRPDRRDWLLELSERSRRDQELPLRLRGFREGRNTLRVRAADYTGRIVSFTFVIEDLPGALTVTPPSDGRES